MQPLNIQFVNYHFVTSDNRFVLYTKLLKMVSIEYSFG